MSHLFAWVMLQKMLLDGLKWKKDKFIFNEEFIENYDENRGEKYILEVEV